MSKQYQVAKSDLYKSTCGYPLLQKAPSDRNYPSSESSSDEFENVGDLQDDVKESSHSNTCKSPDAEPTMEEEVEDSTSQKQRHPKRSCGPPKRLIDEIGNR